MSFDNDIAVESMTPNSSFNTSIYDNSSNFLAEGSLTGSLEYTPSTFVALNNALASISAARSAAVVSVVKYGLPVPAAKIKTRPFI